MYLHSHEFFNLKRLIQNGFVLYVTKIHYTTKPFETLQDFQVGCKTPVGVKNIYWKKNEGIK